LGLFQQNSRCVYTGLNRSKIKTLLLGFAYFILKVGLLSIVVQVFWLGGVCLGQAMILEFRGLEECSFIIAIDIGNEMVLDRKV
jgi:hypothetical protein